MQRLTLVFSLLCFLNLKAQSLPRTCDSCITAQKNQIKDSLRQTLKSKSRIVPDSADANAQKQMVLNKYGDVKESVRTKTDSNARAGYKQTAKNAVMQPLGNAKTLPRSKWELMKSKIPKGKQLFSFTGQLRSESYYTTAQNPIIRSEQAYSRLYISPTITLLGLPFTSNFFFTSEANNTYKNNFFSIRFDAAAMRQNAMNQIQKEMDEAKKLDRSRQLDIQKYKMESGRYQQELDKLEKQVPDLGKWQEELKAEAEKQTKEKLEKEKAGLEERIRNLPEEEKKRLELEFKQKQDSMVNAYKKGAQDSFIRARSAVKPDVDTANLNRYLKLKSRMDELQSKKQELENLRQLDSAKLLEKTQGIRDPDDLKKMAESRLPGKKLLQSVLTVDRFGIGLVNPQYSEFTLYNASIKGIDIGINKNRFFYDLTLGKTTTQFFAPFSNTLPEYRRYIGCARIGLGELRGDYLAFEYLYAIDNEKQSPVQPLVKNAVMNISARVTLLKNLLIEAGAAQSNYRETFRNSETVTINPGIKTRLGPELNRAYNIKATQKIGEQGKLEAGIKQTGTGFRTVGNPFLRRNFREAEFRYEQQFFKKKLKLAGFYKEMRDNILEINSATNRLKGYGLKASTSFEKLPNLTLSYSPYQQGNNHPDSLYRSNNQFSLTTAMITYKKNWKQLQWHALINYTRSAMELGERGNVAYQLISTVHTLQIKRRHTVVLNFISNTTGPAVDSLNSNSIQCTYNYLATKKISYGSIGEYTRYRNGALRAGAGMQMNVALLRNFSISFMGRYDRVNGLWNLTDENVYTGRLMAMWRW